MTPNNTILLLCFIFIVTSCASPQIKPEAFSRDAEMGSNRPKALLPFVVHWQLRAKFRPPPPPYPADALASKAQGTVVVAFNVTERGLVDSATALEGPQELRKASEDYVSRLIFEPYKIFENPHLVRSQMRIDWKLP
jgi:hypothetical protein